MLAISSFGAIRRLDQPVGNAAHGRYHDHNRAFTRRGLHNFGDTVDTRRVAHGRAAKFHHSQSCFHVLGGAAHSDWKLPEAKKWPLPTMPRHKKLYTSTGTCATAAAVDCACSHTAHW